MMLGPSLPAKRRDIEVRYLQLGHVGGQLTLREAVRPVPRACFSKPSEHNHLKMVLQSGIGSTSECFPKHKASYIVRSSYVVCPRYIIFYVTYIGDRNNSVNKAIIILHSLCIFGPQIIIISGGLIYPLNFIKVLNTRYHSLKYCN